MRKRVAVIGGGVALAAVLVGGGVAVAGGHVTGADDEQTFSQEDGDRAEAAALEEAGAGVVSEVEREDEGDTAWEVEVTRDDGSSVEVKLDGDFAVVDSEEEPAEADQADQGVTQQEADRAKEAALAETGGGVVTGVERADDEDAAWEVEVTQDDGTSVDVLLDDGYAVVDVVDDTEDDPEGDAVDDSDSGGADEGADD